ncbi:MAG TPA: DUF6580 family putative transport protein [Terriglobales bacterium]|nr:DUF6580 family putative transport protein [Terriglobales bacterium]
MLAYVFVIFAVAIRFIPHPWHFTPVAASLLFFGARGSRRMIWLPLVLMAGSDLALNRFVYAYPFGWDQLVIWAWYAAILWLGTGLREHVKPLPVIGAALGSSISFFLVSNFMVWAAGTMYPRTWAGLVTCFGMGVPFFRNTVESDLFFTAAMFATPVALHALAGAFGKGNEAAA